MINKKYNGVWFYGISGSGKTIASKYFKKKFKNSLILDGDKIRKHISYDLGYSIKDRKVQVNRMLGLAKICLESKIFPIISTVYMTRNIKKKLYREKICLVQILRDLKKIKNRKKIYNKKMKNVIGVDIKVPQIVGQFNLKNNQSKINFHKRLNKLLNG
tara:strand:+ start:580 stop:1056 length:477 start_codon:yes stop_codon:yes gene_type:complete